MVLLNLSNLPWVPGRLKRNQAIFLNLLRASERFSAGLFVDPPAIVAGSWAKYLGPPRTVSLPVAENVRVFRPTYALPHWRFPPARRSWGQTIADSLRDELGSEPFVLWINSAGLLQCEIAERLAPDSAFCVFDSSDDFTSWEKPRFRHQLDRVLALADRVVCVNDHVERGIAHPNTLVFRNCTDYGTFQRVDPAYRLPPLYPKPPGAVYIGFTGGINKTRADLHLLETLFRRFPSYRFVFIGYTDDRPFLDRLLTHPNVTFLEEAPYADLPFIIRGFDVAIVPHLDNAVTRGNDLLKVLDYFACGVPVVSTRCSNVEEYGDALYMADTAQEFGDRIEELTSHTRLHNPEPGRHVARQRSWATQVPRLTETLFGNELA